MPLCVCVCVSVCVCVCVCVYVLVFLYLNCIITELDSLCYNTQTILVCGI